MHRKSVDIGCFGFAVFAATFNTSMGSRESFLTSLIKAGRFFGVFK
jgi:hypothetical protein